MTDTFENIFLLRQEKGIVLQYSDIHSEEPIGEFQKLVS